MKAQRSDAAVDGPEERRLRRLTLCPVFDVSDNARGLGEPVPVNDAEVCVDRARPVGGTWADWDDFAGRRPCAPPSVAGENVVLDGVPELSELIVTVRKSDYVPSVYAVVTGPGDTDAAATIFGFSCASLMLSRNDALTWLDPAIQPSADRGIVLGRAFGVAYGGMKFGVAGGGMNVIGPLYGAQVAIQRVGGVQDSATSAEGPFFSFNGVYCPEASFTLAPTDAELLPSSPDAAAPGFFRWTGFSFASLEEGEYQVEVTRSGAFCRTTGAYSNPILGFPSSSSGVVAPVLPGHVTHVGVTCLCQAYDAATIDPRTCSNEGVATRPCGGAAP